MKKVCIIGCFADTLDLLNGQTVKTKIVYKEMKNAFGCNEVMKVDTYGGIKTLVKTPIIVLNALIHSQNVIILPAENGLRIIAPLLITFNKVFKRNICYDVIGGWLPEFVNKRKWLGAFLKKINYLKLYTYLLKILKLLLQKLVSIHINLYLQEIFSKLRQIILEHLVF